jgi:hypothetical protein
MTASTSFPHLFDSMTLSTTPSSSSSVSYSHHSQSSCSSNMAENQGPVMINISRPPMIDNGRSVKSSTYTWSDLFIEEEISESSEDDSERTNDNDDNCFVDYETCDETTTITTTTMPPPSSPPSPPSSPPPPRRRRNRSTFYDSNDIKSNSNNNNNNAVEDDEDALKCSTNTSSSSSLSSSTKQSQSQSQGGRGRRRSVRFEQYIEIRTYSIILGDHPSCEDGYSIELGNDVVSVDRIIDLKNDNCSQQQRRLPSKLHRRSFIERKQLLIEVGGYTEQELEKYLGFCNHNTATNGGGGGGLSRVKSVLTNIVNAAA